MQEIQIAITGTAETEVAFFPAKSERAVIFAPGAMFSKESWYFLAERFQQLGISSLALDSGSTADLLNAIAYLKKRESKRSPLSGQVSAVRACFLPCRSKKLTLVSIR